MRIIRALFSAAKSAAKAEPSAWDKFMFKADGYCKYGLLHDDLYHTFDPAVAEAVRRAPEEVINQRIFRQNRAAILSMNKIYLPEEEWTKMEDDERYLQGYIDQVEKEWEEKKNWEENNPL